MDGTAGSASSKCRVALQELSILDRSLCWPLVLVSIVFSLEYSQPLRRSLLSYCTYSQDTILPVCQCDIAEGSWPNCRLSLFRSLPVQWKMASVVVIAVIVISSLGGALFQSKLLFSPPKDHLSPQVQYQAGQHRKACLKQTDENS